MKALASAICIAGLMFFANNVLALTTTQKIQALQPNLSSAGVASLSVVVDSCSGSYTTVQDLAILTFTAIRDTVSCNINVDAVSSNGNSSSSNQMTFFDDGAFEMFTDDAIFYTEVLGNGNLYVEMRYSDGATEGFELEYRNGDWELVDRNDIDWSQIP
jgi:hypothetical protein